MPRPTFSPRATIGGKSLQAGTVGGTALGDLAVSTVKLAAAAVVGPKIGTDSAGLTQVPTALERRVNSVALGQIASGAANRIVFRAPPSGATIQRVSLNFNVAMYHAAAEADTWKFQVTDAGNGNALVKNVASLSGITVAATAWKLLPINNGNSTLLSNAGLRLDLTISGTPQTMTNLVVVTDWLPKNNA